MAVKRERAIQLRLGERSYKVHVGAGLLAAGAPTWRRLIASPQAWLVTDTNVARLHGHPLARRLRGLGFGVHLSVVPAGERSKTLERLELLAREGLRAGLRRDCTILALGGGMVGDLAGFLAGTYLRGVRWLQLPTTLLAQVDASVGGKVAVNCGPAKNSIGMFCQPAAVLADVETLRTLGAREFRSGLAESIKMAAVLSRTDLAWLEAHGPSLRPGSPGVVLGELVHRSVRMKARVVEEDERDHGRRALLNFGHTLGHALEGATGYRKWKHGEAVSIGCAFAAGESVRLGALSEPERARLVGLLRRVGLPVAARGLSEARLLGLMEGDKKQSHKGLGFVLTGPLGDGSVRRLEDRTALRRSLKDFLREGP